MWPVKKVQFQTPFKSLRLRKGWSERELSVRASLSRSTVRNAEAYLETLSLDSLTPLAQELDSDLVLLLFPSNEGLSSYSTVAVSLAVLQDGEESWKQHFFNLVDEFRRTLDSRLFLLPPVPELTPKYFALLASIVSHLAHETGIDAPFWAQKNHWLKTPWFPAGLESLKASAIIESPLWYRANNIFVLENFLQRA